VEEWDEWWRTTALNVWDSFLPASPLENPQDGRPEILVTTSQEAIVEEVPKPGG